MDLMRMRYFCWETNSALNQDLSGFEGLMDKKN
jgi:hypothetical protein